MSALQEKMGKDAKQAIPVLREALNSKDSMSQIERLWVLSKLSRALNKSLKHDEALAYARLGQTEAKAIPVQHIHFTRLIMLVLNKMDQNQAALAEYTRIAPILPTLSGTSGELDGPMEAANAWLEGGTVMSALGQLPEAMELLVRALRVFDATKGQTQGQTDALNQIAHLHFKTGNMEAALREVQRAIDIAEQDKLVPGLARLYMRKAHFMSRAGNVEEQYQALITARELAQKDDNPFNLAVIATNLADVALQRKDYRGTLRFVEEAIPLVEKSADRESLLVCWINKGLAMNRLGQKDGLVLIKRAIDEFAITPGKQDVAAEVQGSLAEELAFNRDFEKAYEAAVDFKKRSDAVRSASDQKRIADSVARYEADKKQRQIELLEQEQRSQKRMQMLWILAGALGLLTTIILLISRLYLKRAYRKVEEMSLSDPLTGLRNRRYLASRIDEDLAQLERQRLTQEREHGSAVRQNADVVFMMIDMDHFKSVNDVHGHAAGDAILKQFSAILMEEVRDADTVVRWGGEEFLIVAKHASCAEIHLLAERVRARVAVHRFDIGGGTVLNKTCSIGFASYPFPAKDQPLPRWEDVVALADQCLYAAKASRRDMWVGIVQRGVTGQMPRQLDARLGVQDGVVELQHSAGRDITWPESTPH
jgi:diguanylate cyclase (GGDEF)-like protein